MTPVTRNDAGNFAVSGKYEFDYGFDYRVYRQMSDANAQHACYAHCADLDPSDLRFLR
jgi:hypothetical protein